MKKGAKLNTAFKGSGHLSPNSQRKQHERVLVASRTKQVPHYAKRGAAPVIGRAARRGPSATTCCWLRLARWSLVASGGGWSGAGGEFEKGVCGGLANAARQVPAPKEVPVCIAVWKSPGFKSLVFGAEQEKTTYNMSCLLLPGCLFLPGWAMGAGCQGSFPLCRRGKDLRPSGVASLPKKNGTPAGWPADRPTSCPAQLIVGGKDRQRKKTRGNRTLSPTLGKFLTPVRALVFLGDVVLQVGRALGFPLGRPWLFHLYLR
jgi:hypothetical protein